MDLIINGKPAVKGQEVTTFRGETGILTGWSEPHKPSSSGKVYVKTSGDWDNMWYPEVINGKFVAKI